MQIDPLKIKAIRDPETSEYKMEVEYRLTKEDGMTTIHSTKSPREQPTKSFIEAMDGLREHVNDICELGLKNLDRLTIRGVSFSYTKNTGIMGATIVAEKELQKSVKPLILTTPHKFAESPTENGGGDLRNLMSAEQKKALRAVLRQAEKYIEGDRQQLQLVFAKEKAAG